MVAILGTLVAGSWLGLNSSLSMTKTTDSKLAELQHVEQMRESISKLTAQDGPAPEERTRLKQRLNETRDSIKRYNDQHRDTVRRERDPDGGRHEDDLI